MFILMCRSLFKIRKNTYILGKFPFTDKDINLVKEGIRAALLPRTVWRLSANSRK